MDEQRWLFGDEVDEMLAAVTESASARKVWLLACACTRALLKLHPSDPDLRCVETAERLADGQATAEDLNAADHDTWWDIRWYRCWPWNSAGRAISCRREDPLPDANVAASKLPALVRCIFGNPFRPFALDPSLVTPTIKGLAEAVDDKRILPGGEFDPVRLAVLADALEEVGAGAEIVGHLRSAGPHVRGCWAVDALTTRACALG
jgi:hypothetical protein